MAIATAFPKKPNLTRRVRQAAFVDGSASFSYSFINTVKLPRDWTFTRSDDTGTRVNSAKQIVVCAANEPRFDHDPVTGTSLGLLADGARTNLLVNSALAGGTTPTGWTLTGTCTVTPSIFGDGS